MRPVHADAVANLSAEQFVYRYAQPLCLGIKQRVLNRAHGERDEAAGRGAGCAVEFRVNALMRADFLADHAGGHPVDDSAHAGCAKALVKFAPTDNARIGGELDEVVIAPACVAGQRLDALDYHASSPPAFILVQRRRRKGRKGKARKVAKKIPEREPELCRVRR